MIGSDTQAREAVVNVESTWQTAHLSERAWYTQLCGLTYFGGRCLLCRLRVRWEQSTIGSEIVDRAGRH